MRRIIGLVAFLILLAVAVLFWPSGGKTIYVGGPILTMDAENRVVGGVGIDGNRIAIVGSEEEVRQWGAGEARIVELDSRALLPGFIDAHGHFPGTGIYAVVADLNSPPIGTVKNIAGLLSKMREQSAAVSRGDWIIGMSYDDTLLEEKRHPTRQELDGISADAPVAILHVSGHLGVVNSKALELLGVEESTPDPEGGHRRRDPATGRLDGLLEETAIEPVTKSAIDLGMLDALTVAREGARRYVAQGVTTAQSGYSFKPQIDGLTLASRLGLIPLRLVLWPGMEVADEMLDGTWAFESFDDEWVRLGAVKLVADGSIQGYTGYLSEPYHVPPGDDPSYRGYPRIARAELIERVARYHAAGLQVAVHGNGDASIDDILDALEQAQRQAPRVDSRPIIIHAQMAREDQLDRMAALGVIPSFFSLHTYYWGDRHRDLFMGPARAARMSPARSAERRSIPFTIHADCPVVPMEPLRLVWSAVNRRTTSGKPMGDEQRISPMSALRAVTINAARQHFEEGSKGSIEVGKLADLVILSRSPLVDPETIDEIEVIETVIGGKTVYQADWTLSMMQFDLGEIPRDRTFGSC